MAHITFLGGEETGNVAYVDWGRFRFHINQPVECDDKHIIAKAAGNRFFSVESEGVHSGEILPPKILKNPGVASNVEAFGPKVKMRAKRAASQDDVA